MLFSPEINYSAVLVAGIIGMAVGALWYSPMLFGKQWMKWNGMSMEHMEAAKKGGMGKRYFAGFIGTLFMSCTIAHVILYARAYSLFAGKWIGGMIAIGIAAPILLGSVLWENKPVKLWLLNSGYYLVTFAIMGAILGAWQ